MQWLLCIVAKRDIGIERRAGNDAFGPRQNAAADHSRVSFKALKSVPN